MVVQGRIVAAPTVPSGNYRFWMTMSALHLALITALLAGTLLVPYMVGDPPSDPGSLFSLVLVLLLLVPYIWVTMVAAKTIAKISRSETDIEDGFPLTFLRRINVVGFLFDACVLVLFALSLRGAPLPRIGLIVAISLLVVIAFALPPAVFVAKIHLTRVGNALVSRLDELRRLQRELRQKHGDS